MSASIQSLSNELLLVIFHSLPDPGAFSRTCKKYYSFSQDPFARASWFIAQYGKREAFFWALGRGKVCDEKVLDHLIHLGAPLSRYFLQLVSQSFTGLLPVGKYPFLRAQHHYPWPRSLRFPVFAHLLALGAKKYGDDVPLGKGMDDRSVWTRWLDGRQEAGVSGTYDGVAGYVKHREKEERERREEVKEAFQKYGFGPFCPKDFLFMELPIAIAHEPSILPLAALNGYHLDVQTYRDFIFRKVFELPTHLLPREKHEETIVSHVRELQRLDKRLFLSRTVAAEVCMEVITNQAAFTALSQLDCEGDLRFTLSDVVSTLVTLFSDTRALSDKKHALTFHDLLEEYPIALNNHRVRHTFLQSVFACHYGPTDRPAADRLYIHEMLDHIGVRPLDRDDVLKVLECPLVEVDGVEYMLEYARENMEWEEEKVKDVVREAARACLDIPAKGSTLEYFCMTFPFVNDTLLGAVPELKLDVSSLGGSQGGASSSKVFAQSNLGCRFEDYKPYRDDPWEERMSERERRLECLRKKREDWRESQSQEKKTVVPEPVDKFEAETDMSTDSGPESPSPCRDDDEDLGCIDTRTLTNSIARSGLAHVGGNSVARGWLSDLNVKEHELALSYPLGAKSVGLFVLDKYKWKHPMTAHFLSHALVNGNDELVHDYIVKHSVPVTLEHFHILSKLGREVWPFISACIVDQPFYATEDDYVTTPYSTSPAAFSAFIKPKPVPSIPQPKPPKTRRKRSSSWLSPMSSISSPCKRPRRAAASVVKTYAPTGSDDEDTEDCNYMYDSAAGPESDSDGSEYGVGRKRKRQTPKTKSRAKMEDIDSPDKQVVTKKEADFREWIQELTLLVKAEEKIFAATKREWAREGKGRPRKSEFLRTLGSQVSMFRNMGYDATQKWALNLRGKGPPSRPF